MWYRAFAKYVYSIVTTFIYPFLLCVLFQHTHFPVQKKLHCKLAYSTEAIRWAIYRSSTVCCTFVFCLHLHGRTPILVPFCVKVSHFILWVTGYDCTRFVRQVQVFVWCLARHFCSFSVFSAARPCVVVWKRLQVCVHTRQLKHKVAITE